MSRSVSNSASNPASNGAPAVETDVLVVGSGPGGAAAALFLATYGTRTMVVTRYGHLSDTPRAHITNQRTMETLRDMGLEERLMREATPWEWMGNTTFCTSLAGDELGRIPSWGTDTRRHHDYELQSPCTMLDAPQTITEPVMVQAAQARGAKVRFDTEYLSHEQDDSGVTTQVRDRLTGTTYAIRSKYMVGADGARSKVAADLDLPFEGPGAVGGALHIIFEADLSRFVDYRPSVLYWMVQPGAEKEGVGLGVLRMIKPWHEWMLMWGYEVAAGPPEITDEFARELAVQLVGTEDFEMRVTSAAALDGEPSLRHHDRPAAGSSASATPCTGTRRPTGWAPTPRSRTPTTWPGSCITCCRHWPPRPCSIPTTPSGPRSPGRSWSGPTRASPTPAGSSPRSTLTTPPTWTS